MIEIVKELRKLLKEKRVSPETAAGYIGASGREVRRWVDGEAVPNLLSRQAIKSAGRYSVPALVKQLVNIYQQTIDTCRK